MSKTDTTRKIHNLKSSYNYYSIINANTEQQQFIIADTLYY